MGKTSKTKESGVYEGLEKHSEQLHKRAMVENEAGEVGRGEIMKSLCLFVCLFIQQIFVENLLCVSPMDAVGLLQC